MHGIEWRNSTKTILGKSRVEILSTMNKKNRIEELKDTVNTSPHSVLLYQDEKKGLTIAARTYIR